MDEIKRYDFSRKPKKPSVFWMTIARLFAVNPRLIGRKLTRVKINMEGVKPPYFLLATHASMLDYPAMYKAISPHNANNVVAIDAVRDVGDFFMRELGCICKRKFVKDYHLIRHMRYCAEKYKDIVCVYPEARYSFDGTTSFLPDSLGKMCKVMKVPVVVLRIYGTFISAPQWNKPEQKLPLRTELELIATAEETQTLPASELNARIKKAMARDDFAYQYENKIKNPYPRRADGLHGILYQCPHCKKEFEMDSAGVKLWCNACKKEWEMDEYGRLHAKEGETEFAHIPDWVKWERQLVREEVRSGKYRFEADVTVHTLPNAKRFYDQGMGRLVQTSEGTRLTCTAYGQPVDLFWTGAQLESVHIEFDYPFRKKKYHNNVFGDSIDISVKDDSYWLHPVNMRDRLTKVSFATEEIYFLDCERARAAIKGENAPKKDEEGAE